VQQTLIETFMEHHTPAYRTFKDKEGNVHSETTYAWHYRLPMVGQRRSDGQLVVVTKDVCRVAWEQAYRVGPKRTQDAHTAVKKRLASEADLDKYTSRSLK
jgi:hypothetical protein